MNLGLISHLKCKVGEATKGPPPLWTSWGPSGLSFPHLSDRQLVPWAARLSDGGGALRPLGQRKEKGTDGVSPGRRRPGEGAQAWEGWGGAEPLA